MAGSPFRATGGGVRVDVRLTPKASANRIQGVERDATGAPVLKAAVTAVPEGGKANAALLKLLARAWKLPKTSLCVVSGATARRKVIKIAGDPGELLAKLREWGKK